MFLLQTMVYGWPCHVKFPEGIVSLPQYGWFGAFVNANDFSRKQRRPKGALTSFTVCRISLVDPPTHESSSVSPTKQ